jgi:hypothetical protein
MRVGQGFQLDGSLAFVGGLWRTPISAAAASNRRPMLEVSGLLSCAQLGVQHRALLGAQVHHGGRSASHSRPALPQVGQRHARGPAHGAVAAGQGHVGQVEAALVFR